SVASSGFWTSCRKVYFSFSLRYSGSARPAWRISQTGGRSTGRQWQASRKRWRKVHPVEDGLGAVAIVAGDFVPGLSVVEVIRLPEGRICVGCHSCRNEGITASVQDC